MGRNEEAVQLFNFRIYLFDRYIQAGSQQSWLFIYDIVLFVNLHLVAKEVGRVRFLFIA